MEWPLLAGLSEEDRRAFLATARRRTFRAGEVVVHRDDPADAMHLVVKGAFAIRIVTPLGDVATLAVLFPGDTFGEVALLLAERRRTATVEALEAGETRAVHHADFAALRRRHPEVDVVLAGVLAAKVEQLSRQVVEALYVPADGRVLRRLSELSGRYGPNGAGHAVVPLTQDELAGLAGAARATVNRVLRDAERRGEVALSRGRVTVLDADALRRRCGLAR
jgi:CRP-like cAMP-binding protein